MTRTLREKIERIAGKTATEITALGGGCVFGASRVRFEDGQQVVVKQGRGPVPAQLALEGWMLEQLAQAGWPVPRVLHAEDELLVMEWIESDGSLDGPAQVDAGRLIAGLHAVTGPSFGLDRDTAIGALAQPNRAGGNWRDFFRDQRLIHMAEKASGEGVLPVSFRRRLDRLASRLEDYLSEPAGPVLLHGDLWGGNILARGGRIAAVIDPAIYHGHPEIELAFSTLFNSFGARFFDAYQETAPLEPGFFEIRRDIYNLYPLLVHLRLFGASYLSGIDRTLKRVGL